MARKTILSDEGILSAIDKLGEQLEQNIIDTVSKKVTSGTEKGIKEANKKLKATKAKLEEATVVLEKVAVEVDDDALRKQAESVINKSVKNKPIKVKSKVEVEPEVTYKPKYNMYTNPKKGNQDITNELRKYYKALEDGGTEGDEKKFVGYFSRAKADGLELKEDYNYLFKVLTRQSDKLQSLFQGVTEEYKKRLDMVVEMERKTEAISTPTVSKPDKNGILSGGESVTEVREEAKAAEELNDTLDINNKSLKEK